MKRTVLVTNPGKAEGAQWSAELEKAGYQLLDVQQNLAEMVNILSREPVDFAVCSSELIAGDAYDILEKMRLFFPRLQVIVVGFVPLSGALPNLSKVAFKKTFDCDLQGNRHREHPATPPTVEELYHSLLHAHFMNNEQVAELCNEAGLSGPFSFAVLLLRVAPRISTGLLADLQKAIPQNAYLFAETDHVCIVLANMEDTQAAMAEANSLRTYLFDTTDINFSIGVSRIRTQPSELYISRREALRASAAEREYGLNSVIHIEYLDKKDTWYAYPHHKEQRMIECAMDGDVAQAKALLDEIFLFLEQREKQLSERFIRSVGLRIWSGMGLAAGSRMLAFETTQMDSLSFGKLVMHKDLQKLHASLKQGVEQMAMEMEAMQELARDALYTHLTSLRAKGKKPSPQELADVFHTTIAFLNDAISQNSQDTVFDFFK